MTGHADSGQNFGRGDQADDVLDGEVGREPAGKRGRPKGSVGTKAISTREFEEWFWAQGKKGPLQHLAERMWADPVQLQKHYAAKEMAVKAVGDDIRTALPSLHDIQIQQDKCARELAPYLHGKKPIEIVMNDERLPVMFIDMGSNQLETAQRLAKAGGMMIDAVLIEDDEKQGKKR